MHEAWVVVTCCLLPACLPGVMNCLFVADSANTLTLAELDIAAMDNEIQRWYSYTRIYAFRHIQHMYIYVGIFAYICCFRRWLFYTWTLVTWLSFAVRTILISSVSLTHCVHSHTCDHGRKLYLCPNSVKCVFLLY